MSQERNINSAFNFHLEQVGLAFPIAWENTDYKPGVDPFLVPTMLPAESIEFAKTQFPKYDSQETGIFQVSVYFPAGLGVGDALSAADRILSYFQENRGIATGLSITSAYRNSGRVEGGWYITDLSIAYSMLTTLGD